MTPRILVVDLSDLVIEDFLIKLSKYFLCTCSHDDLIDFLDKEEIDFLILHDSVGFDLMTHSLNEVRKRRRLKDLPILCISEIEKEKQMLKLIDLGVSDFCKKPVKAFEILSRIELVLKIKSNNEKIMELNEELKELSQKDPLTSVYNRYILKSHAKTMIHEAEETNCPLSILMIDIDHFKQVNDRYGHLIGDEILVKLSNFLKQHLRTEDLIIRYGGEEFILFLPYTQKNQASIVAEKLRLAVERHNFQTEAGKINITISIGGTCVCAKNPMQGVDSMRKLLREADEALYEAKKRGRNQAVLTTDEL